jgi:hypothetical protein
MEPLRVLPGHFDKQPTHALGHETYRAPRAFHPVQGLGIATHSHHAEKPSKKGEPKLAPFALPNAK